MKSRIVWSQKAVWKKEWKQDTLLIYDLNLEAFAESRAWIRKFPARYGVRGGEAVKSIDAFPSHLRKITELAAPFSTRKMTVIVAGGGSVGDFGGFVASIFKRGVRLIHVPTTWLAALDSAHGGKTALNVAGSKNQIGNFYPADEIHVFRSFLMKQPAARLREAAGEYLKMALLVGGPLFTAKWTRNNLATQMWRRLPSVAQAKMRIVAKDPLEKKGLRHLLNLGHTMGHVFESESDLPHGLAVAYGLVFALIFSKRKGVCAEKDFEKILRHPLWSLYLPSPDYLKAMALPPARVRKQLLRDKKSVGSARLRFIFMKGPGRPVIKDVPVEEIVAEMRRQSTRLRGLYA